MMTEVPPLAMSPEEVEAFINLKGKPEWDTVCQYFQRRCHLVLTELLRCDPQLDGFYKGAAAMMTAVLAASHEADLHFESLKEGDEEDG